MASVTYSLARATALMGVMPRASPAATAEAKVHPVPWVFLVSILNTLNSWKSLPS